MYKYKIILVKKKINKKEKAEQLKEFLIVQGEIFSKQLIRDATEYEKILMRQLIDLDYNFQFQVPIVVPVGKSYKLYILDFLLTDYNIFIEADGKAWHSSKEQIKKDNLRTKHLQKQGLHPLRLSNKQIMVFNKNQIADILKQKILLITPK